MRFRVLVDEPEVIGALGNLHLCGGGDSAGLANGHNAGAHQSGGGDGGQRDAQYLAFHC